MIGKQHFTLLYNRARRKAITPRNITSGWSKTGLRPFNPDRVLKEIQKPEITFDERSCEPLTIETSGSNQEFHELQTPKTSDNLISLRRDIEKTIAQGGELDSRCKLRIQKIANAAENAFADCAILLDENLLLSSKTMKRASVSQSKQL